MANLSSLLESVPEKIRIRDKYIGRGEPVFFIAEIGNNHNGDFDLARRSVIKAVEAGADAVKIQKRFVKDVFAKELLEKEQTKDQVYGKTYGEYRENLELNMEEFVKLRELSNALDTIFFATPFDHKSVDFLETVGVDVYKVASFDVTNLPLLQYIAEKGKPMFMSFGMSTEEEIDEALETVLPINNRLIINHCVSIYPTPDDKLNLSAMNFMKEKYHPLLIGYSGHEQDILPSLMAVTMGATAVERHFTLSHDLPGPDHATVSIEPQTFRELVDGSKRVRLALGQSKKILYDDEVKTRNKHSKSLVSMVAIPNGTVISSDMLHCKSPGYGLKPNTISKIVGKKTKVDVPADTVMVAEFIEWI